MTPDIPSALYGRVLNFIGVEYCYTADANAFIDAFRTFYNTETAGASAAFSTIVDDTTVRTDAACRYYSITPKALDDNSFLSVWVFGKWGGAGAGQQLKLGRVTLYFQPTNTLVSAPKGLETPFEPPSNPSTKFLSP